MLSSESSKYFHIWHDLSHKKVCFLITALWAIQFNCKFSLHAPCDWLFFQFLNIALLASFIPWQEKEGRSNPLGKQGCTTCQCVWDLFCILHLKENMLLTTFSAGIRNRGGKEIIAGSPVGLKTSEVWSRLGKGFLFSNLEVVFPLQKHRKT